LVPTGKAVLATIANRQKYASATGETSDEAAAETLQRQMHARAQRVMDRVHMQLNGSTASSKSNKIGQSITAAIISTELLESHMLPVAPEHIVLPGNQSITTVGEHRIGINFDELNDPVFFTLTVSRVQLRRR
jgi:ribosomal protein L9